MKRNLLILFCIILFSAFKLADDIIARLGTEHPWIRHHILGNMVKDFDRNFNESDTFKIPYCRLLPSIISGDKVGAAREMCVYIKSYINSQEFADAYAKKREAAKPASEPWRPDAEQIADQQKSIKQMEKELADGKKAKWPATQIDLMKQAIASNKAILADWEDPTPNKTKWEKFYPEDPAIAVKARLQEYLVLANTVDFSAVLLPPDKYKVKKFANAAYEKKSTEWKACYRAGKEVNEMTTAFVKEWLNGEIVATNKISMPVPSTSSNASPKTTSATQPVATGTNAGTPPVIEEKVPKEKKSLFKKLKEKVIN